MASLDVKKLKKFINDPAVIGRFRSIRAIAGSSRLQILYLLDRERSHGLTVTDLSEVLKASLSRISHQMKILKKAGMVTTRKEGRNVIYSAVISKVSRFVKW